MKRSEIAAARVQVALAKRRGEEPEEWIADLADTPMSQADAYDNSYKNPEVVERWLDAC